MSSEVVHVEVTGKDGKALQRFYSEVFGWKLDTNNPGEYGMLRQDSQKITGGVGAARAASGADRSRDGGFPHLSQ